jgi:undecaprenyl-phosphate 4-deoxy-4-formamido-L-arabinose transferase
LVNDGSKDDSRHVCEELARSGPIPVTFVDLSRNFGQHNALITGLRYARGDFVITMDDDLQNPPSEVQHLYAFTKSQDLDVVYSYYEKKKDAPWRNLGSRFANATANMVLDKPKGLYVSSFRCMTKFIAEQVVLYQGPYPYIDGLIFLVTANVKSLKVEHSPRTVRQSNYTLAKLIKLWISILVNFSVKPLRLATLLGGTMSALGFSGGVYILANNFLYGVPVQGWLSLILTVLLFSGVQMLMLGMIGEYLGRLYLTANGTPQSIVRKVLLPGGAPGKE